MNDPDTPQVARYVTAWRGMARRPEHNLQLATTINMGNELDHLTRISGLRRLLKMMREMMRGPARLTGLGSSQRVLESGFDTFASMGANGDGTRHFLNAVQLRESGFIERLFANNRVACEAEISAIVCKSR